MNLTLREQFERLALRQGELDATLSDPQISSDIKRWRSLSREQAEVRSIVERFRRYQQRERDAEAARGMLADADLAQMAQEEIAQAHADMQQLHADLQAALIPRDPDDDRNAFLEIRAGTGGDESALFSGDLLRMYTRFAERQRWQVEIVSSSESELGGYREVIARIVGQGAYSKMKFESGTHRVQRVPATETQGRIHTSAATVAVLPEAEEVDVTIEDKDLRIDVFRASGPGGQSVNTTDSAVRITHIPSGIVVSQQDQKSQLQNKLKGMQVLRSRLLDQRLAKIEAERSQMRSAQVGTGDRSAKIRTYNYPQDRITDHRIGLSVHGMQSVMDGNIGAFIDALQEAEVKERLGG